MKSVRPLNSIIGLSYLSRANLGDEKKVLENFDKIEMSAQFLRSCMDDILNLSLLESGRVAFNEESTVLKHSSHISRKSFR